jgi:YegS/Rv2252/BmrU family lipid kinase
VKQLKAELIINTGSRRGRAALPIIVSACERQSIDLARINVLKKETNLRRVIAAIEKRKPELVLVGGGDGTISDAVDHFAGSSIQVGVLPLGTTNNFARSLGMPLDLDDAVATIKHGKVSNVDLGKINDELFVNVAGIGISAKIAKNVTDKQKRRFGRFAYAINGITQLIRHKPFLATIEDKDSELQLHLETHQIIIANGRYHAGKEIAKDAKIDNRELIIFALGGKSKLSFIIAMADFYFGKRKNIRHASYLTGNSINLRTNTPQLVELDGEVKFTTPIPVEVAPGAVRVRH